LLNNFRFASLSQQLSLDFQGVAVTLNEMKECSRELKSCYEKFNKSSPVGKAEINKNIFECMENTLNSWTSKVVRESNILDKFIED